MKGSAPFRECLCVQAVAVLLAAVAFLALSACGGASTTSSTSASAAPSQAAVSPSPSWSPTMSPAPIPVVKPGQKLPPWSQILALYAYDRSEPLAVRWVPNMDLTVSGVKLRAMKFQQDGEEASAHLVLPEGEGPFPAVVFAPGHGGDADVLDYWAEDAARLAKKGYAGLLVGETTAPLWTWDGRTDVRGLATYVSLERRALDVLETMSEIDPTRIGFAGFSTGAMVGGLLSAVDPRIKVFALDGVHSGGLENWSAQDRADMKARDVSPAAYSAQMALVDTPTYIKHNKDGKFLFIWGKAGDGTPSLQKRFAAAAGPHGSVYMQAGGHGVTGETERVVNAWIVNNL